MKLSIKHTEDGKGLYLIINKITNQAYVGSTRNSLYKRMVEHRRYLRKNKHVNKRLQNSFNKYGESNFYFKHKIIKTESLILEMEQKFYNLYKPYYNIATDMLNGGKPNLGIKLNESWKKNLVESRKGYKHSEEVLTKVTNNNKKNATKLKFSKENEVLEFDSYKQASIYFEVSNNALINANIRYKKWKDWKIEILKKQAKQVKLSKDDFEIILKSTLEADRYLDIWRGATSFYYKRDGEVKGYKIEYIN